MLKKLDYSVVENKIEIGSLESCEMDSSVHSEFILKEESPDTGHITPQSSDGSSALVPDSPEGSIGIRPQPLICKPENIDCKSEPIETKWHWAPGAWQDATRTSAFQPYKPPTLLTNLQRGNTKTQIPLLYASSDITFHTLAGQGEITPENIHSESIDDPDEDGLTGLMWASAYGQLGSARLLLKAGANKNLHGNKGETALHLAAGFGHHDLVKLLLSHGANSNARDKEGNTPLIYAAIGDHPHVCYELMTNGADVTHRNVHRISAYQAASLKNASTAKAVIHNYIMQQYLLFD